MQIVRQTKARHRMIIKSNTISKKTDETADSIYIVGKNKKKIMEIITTCLEKPFYQMLQKWFEDFDDHGWTEIIEEIKDILKYLVYDRSGTEFIVPDNVKDYLFR